MTLVIAHRGASGQRPENTMPAYDLALAQRADMIEIDLHRTRDGAIVITHDEDLTALGGRGEIADASADYVCGLDAGGGERVPILADVLDRYGARIPFNLELKTGTRAPYPDLPRETLRAVEERDLLAVTLFSSFSDVVLAELRRLSPAARIGCLVSPREPERWLERARAVGACAVNLWSGLATPDAMAKAHGAGLAVNVYTVDRHEEMRVLIDRGVDGIFTNHPDRLRGLLAGARILPSR